MKWKKMMELFHKMIAFIKMISNNKHFKKEINQVLM